MKALLWICFGIESPAFGAGFRIQRDDFIEGCTENQRIFDEYRRALRRRTGHLSRTIDHIAGREGPGDFERMHIVRRYRRKLAVTMSTIVCAIAAPAMTDVDRVRRATYELSGAVDIQATCAAQVVRDRPAQQRQYQDNQEPDTDEEGLLHGLSRS